MKIKDYVKDTNQSVELITEYIPYCTKVDNCKRIVDATCYRINELLETNVNQFRLDSTSQYLLYVMVLVDLYTNLDVDFGSLANEYDLLKSNKVLDEILKKIPENEMVEFDRILEMVNADLMENERSLVSFIENKFLTMDTALSAMLKTAKENEEQQ